MSSLTCKIEHKYVQEGPQDKSLDGKDELRVVANTVCPSSLGHGQAEVLHPFGSFAWDAAPLHLLTRSFAAVLSPEFFLSLLAFLLKTLDDVDGAAGVERIALRRFAEAVHPMLRPVEEGVGDARQ